jgi:hypothetical protein
MLYKILKFLGVLFPIGSIITFGKDRKYFCFLDWLFRIRNYSIEELIAMSRKEIINTEHKEQYLRYNDKPKQKEDINEN